MRKITYITGTRADYGLMRQTLKTIEKHPELELTIVATGMHLMQEFGETIQEITNDGFQPIIVDATHKKDERESMALFFSEFGQGLVKAIQKNKPDIILILGDRAEMLAGAIVGNYLNIPVVHLHGGEQSGHVDDLIRHAITKLAQIHLPATKKSARYIESLGEKKETIHVVGAPGLVGIHDNIVSKEEFYKKIGLDIHKPFYLVVEHPVNTSIETSDTHMQTLLSTLQEEQTVIIYPNADAGGRKIISVIKKYEHNKNFFIYKHMPRDLFLNCMAHAKAILGNSSAGIIEAASFQTGVINRGDRQQNRERSGNTIDIDYNKQSLVKALQQLENKTFKNKLLRCHNIYGDGKTDQKVAELLASIKVN